VSLTARRQLESHRRLDQEQNINALVESDIVQLVVQQADVEAVKLRAPVCQGLLRKFF